VLDAPEVNAFAVPGGTVFVTKGLVQHMQSEAQLAGVLAHEISHVLRKHHLKAIQKGAQTSLAGEALQQALKDQSGLAREKLITLGSELYTRGLDKSDEFEADRLGVVIAARGGYDSYGLPAVLQALQAMNAQDSALALMFKTHPAPGERLTALGDTMQKTLDAYASQPQLADRFLAQLRR
jgi:predicted Zn-dependent protease